MRNQEIFWTEFQSETVACEPWKNVEVNMEDLLTSRFSIGQELVHALAANATGSEGSSNAHSHCEDVATQSRI